MFARLRIITLGAALFAAPGTAAADSGGFLKVPQEVWTNINRFVFLVALDISAVPGTPEYQRRNVLRSWPQIYAAGKQWSDVTFPALGQLATEIVQDDIGVRLQAMVQAAQNGDRGAFDTAAAGIEGKLAALSGRAGIIKGQIDHLAEASRTMRLETSQLPAIDPALHQIEVKGGEASKALGAATLAWGGLQSDVIELRRVVEKAQRVDADWYARIGIKRWADVTGDARAFLSSMSTQQRYLRGEDYYDNCGIVADQWIRFGVTGVRYMGWGDYIGSYSTIVWQFSRLGNGWWRVRAKDDLYGPRQLNREMTLDGTKDNVYLVDPAGPLTSGQFWRAIPAGDGLCSFYNSFEGAGYTLYYAVRGTRENFLSLLPMKLMPARNEWAQQWSITCYRGDVKLC